MRTTLVGAIREAGVLLCVLSHVAKGDKLFWHVLGWKLTVIKYLLTMPS